LAGEGKSVAENLKPLLAVIILAIPAFLLTRQLCAPFISSREFGVWRNAWFAATAAAFLSGNFLIFAAAMLLICTYSYAARATTPALFLILLLAVPLVDIPLPGFGSINYLFAINNGRVLAIALLVPLLFGARGLNQRLLRSYTIPDLLVVSYVLLLIVLQFRSSEITNVARVAFVRTVDILIPYLAFSRINVKAEDFRKVMAAYVVATLPLCMVAMMEVLKRWHPYAVVFQDWGFPLQYLEREGLLRAAATSGGGITLGYLIMVGIGCMLALWQPLRAWKRFAVPALLVLAMGLIATFSRGPWVGTLALVIAFVGTGPRAGANFAKLVIVAILALLPLLLTGFGEKIVNFLPFIGSVDEFNVTYRTRLFENSIAVIERNFWLGSTDFLSAPEMRELVQGEGIVDTVNSYLGIALTAGIIGLSLFVAFFASVMLELYRIIKRRFAKDRNYLNRYARASFGILLGILVAIGTTSSIDYVPYIYWSFGGIFVALIRIARASELSSREPALQMRSEPDAVVPRDRPTRL
jgi:O-Antigen ligase